MTDLDQQIQKARRRIVADGYDMSVGELINLYKDDELVINPAYQRYFRWDDSQKTRFIESMLLGIPTPPIFVFQQTTGAWELIDGLQRLSTVLEFVGTLRTDENSTVPPSSLEGTNLVPRLAGITWESLPIPQRLALRRSRIRVEILKQESDEDAKFELFQRLNTGGSQLSAQEVRNCVLVMVDQGFHDWLKELTNHRSFQTTVDLSKTKRRQQQDMEIALRYLAYCHVPYKPGLDVNEYLDRAALRLARRLTGPTRKNEHESFCKCFDLLEKALGGTAFKKWDGHKHGGPFLLSGFEGIAHGISHNMDVIAHMQDSVPWIKTRVREMWQQDAFQRYSGRGVRGTTRIKNLLPFGERFFRP